MSNRARQRWGRRVLVGVACWGFLFSGPVALADSTISGVASVPKLLGGNDGPLELFEWNIFIHQDGDRTFEGKSWRIGQQGGLGFYTFTVPGGSYSMIVDQPLFWGRPEVIPNVVMPSSGSVNQNVTLPTDYSVAFGNKSDIWGSNPWTGWEPAWYQTFRATGTSITGIDFKLAGTNAGDMRVSIHRDNGGNVTTWPQVGMTRIRRNLGALADQWIRFRSGELPTTPGDTYALKLEGTNGTPNNDYAIYRRNKTDGGYAFGRAWNSSGAAQNFDLYAIIFSDSSQTVVPYCVVVQDAGSLTDWGWAWQQGVRAVGNGLAGVSIFSAGGDWNTSLRFRARINSPTGPQVGPTKAGRTAFQAASSSMGAASWNPGEVSLTPGQIYYVEITGNPPESVGLNPYHMTHGENAYPDGHAYNNGNPLPNTDLLMQVVEYADATPPEIDAHPTSFVHSIRRGQNLSNDVFNVSNSGGGVLSYSINDNAAWLSLDPDQGLSAGETDPIGIVYSTTSLNIGLHVATITINAPGATNHPQMATVNLTVMPPEFAPADFDRDHDVDQADFGFFQSCLTGPGIAQDEPLCSPAHLDEDEDVDQDDFGIFQGCMSGADVQADPVCAG